MIYFKHPETSEVFAYASMAERGDWGAPELVEMTEAEVSAHLNPAAPAPTPEQVQAAFTAAIQQRLDDFARTRNYDGILSACTYATSSVPKFATEGQYCVDARDATWTAAYAILAEVLAETRPMPASIEDIEADLPALAWPADPEV